MLLFQTRLKGYYSFSLIVWYIEVYFLNSIIHMKKNKLELKP